MTDAGARRVLTLGEALIDLIVADDAGSLEAAGAFVARPGGAPANVAVALARLGVPAAFGGVVGADPFGNRLRSVLQVEGVDTSRLRSADDAATSLAFAWKDEEGDGHFRLLRLADRLLSPEDAARAGIEQAAALVVGSVALAAEPSRSAIERAVEIASAAGVPVCFDVNLRPMLWPDLGVARGACLPIVQAATLLKLSLDDARYLFGTGDDPPAAMAEARRSPPRVIVVTDGARGAWFACRGVEEVRHVAAFDVEAVEPTGAGDAFTAALIARLLSHGWMGLDVEDVRYASAAGALATTAAGAMDGLPTAVDLARFLAA